MDHKAGCECSTYAMLIELMLMAVLPKKMLTVMAIYKGSSNNSLETHCKGTLMMIVVLFIIWWYIINTSL